MGILDTCPWGPNEPVKPQREKFRVFVFRSEIHKFRWMETEPSLFDLGNDEVTGVWTAVKPVGELKEIFELFD